MVDGINDDGFAKETADYALIDFIAGDERVGDAEDSILPKNRLDILREGGVVSHGSQRKEGGSSKVTAFQVFNQVFRSALVVCHNILESTAKCGFNGSLVFFVGLDQIRYDAVNAGIAVFLLHHALDAVAVSLVPFGNVPERFETGSLSVIGGLTGFQLMVLPIEQMLECDDLLFLFRFRFAVFFDLGADCGKFFLIFSEVFLFPGFVFLHLQDAGGKLGFSYLDLLKHCVVTLKAFPDRSPVVQERDGIAAALFCGGIFSGDLRLDFGRVVLAGILLLFGCCELFCQLLLFLPLFVRVAYPGGFVFFNGSKPVTKELPIGLCRADLFAENVDLAFVLLLFQRGCLQAFSGTADV